MKRDLITTLCCPKCKGELNLSSEKEVDTIIIKGTLTCALCAVDYPIQDGIPILLPQDNQ